MAEKRRSAVGFGYNLLGPLKQRKSSIPVTSDSMVQVDEERMSEWGMYDDRDGNMKERLKART